MFIDKATCLCNKFLFLNFSFNAIKSLKGFDKEKYTKFDVTKIDNRTIRLDAELKINDEQKKEYETPEKAKKAIEALGFTCKE